MLRKGGTARITEGEWGPESNSPALTWLFDLLCQAFSQAGHSFTSQRDGIICQLEHLMEKHGFEHIQRRLIAHEYHAGTEAWSSFFEEMKLTFRMLPHFLHKWTRVPAEYEHFYQQALEDMQRPDFLARGNLLTVWGSTP